MDETPSKQTLIQVADRIHAGKRIYASQAEPFLAHKFKEISPFAKFMLRLAAWISLFFASVLVIFPEVGEKLIEVLPDFFNLPERLAKALDYIWGLVGKPVGKQHLMYHLPNIIIYAFGVAGVRQLWRKIHKNNWKDRVVSAQEKLTGMIEKGAGCFTFEPGFSLLFAGEGDRVAKSLVLDHPLIGPTLASQRPPYTPFWVNYDPAGGDELFESVLGQFNCAEAGEFVLFPVLDEHLFLPGPHEHDMPPHRVEIAVRRIREFEREQGWDRKQIIIVGDKEQKSQFVTTSQDGNVTSKNDDISLRTIQNEYADVIVADPTDITLRKIIEIAQGRQILFRASDQGAEKYAREFFHRLSLLDYTPSQEGCLTVGYDISDLETEHQVMSRADAEYLPVILSRDVFDLLSNTYLCDRTHIFVPRLVKEELQKLVA